MEEGRDICVYTRGKWRLGHLECGEEGGEWFLIKYQIIPDGGSGLSHESASTVFRYVTHWTSAVGLKRYLICPVCTQQRQNLYFARAWACAECHKLLRRSQVIPPRVRLEERREELTKQVGRGRPLGMHSATYMRLRAELEEVSREVKKRPWAVSSEAHDQLVQEEWRSMEEDDEWQRDQPENWWVPGHR
jgi:protein-arginine kinase activator protein McsA